MKPIESFKLKNGNEVRIYPDEDAESPREWDNLGVMVCFHGNYNLGDKTGLSSDSFSSWSELKEYLFDKKGALFLFPLWLYDHSGITMRAGEQIWVPSPEIQALLGGGSKRLNPFRQIDYGEWDSGQVGYIYTTEACVLEWWGAKELTADLLDNATKVLLDEVEEYDNFISGDYVSYEEVDKSGNVVDSCGSYTDADAVRAEFEGQIVA